MKYSFWNYAWAFKKGHKISFSNLELNFRPKVTFNHFGIGYKSKTAKSLPVATKPQGVQVLSHLNGGYYKVLPSLKSCSAHAEQRPGIIGAPHESDELSSFHLSALYGSGWWWLHSEEKL